MPVKLRLRRQGRKKRAHFAIVAADSRAPRDGKFIEKIGYYDPITEPAKVYVDHEAALKWLQVGAQPTHTVRSLFRHAGVNLKFALTKQGKSEEEMERIFTRWWEEKKGKKKKKFIQVDVHGQALEEVPDMGPSKQHAGESNQPKLVEESVEEAETPVEETETPAAEAETPAQESEAPAEVAAEAAPEAEAPAAEEEKKEE